MSVPRGSVRLDAGPEDLGAGDVGEELTRAMARWARGQEASRMDRDKMLEVALTQIEKQYGKGAVMKLGEHPMGAGIGVIPTGSLALALTDFMRFPEPYDRRLAPSSDQEEDVEELILSR